MAKSYREKNLLSLAGEFAVASQLCLRGYVASLTLKNYPGVDVFAHNPKNGKHITIQVKASTDGYFRAPDKLTDDGILIYVSINKDKLEYYVLPTKEVIELRDKELKDYLEKHPNVKKEQPIWLGRNEHFPSFKDRWDILGLD